MKHKTNSKVVKIIGIAASLIGAGCTLVSGWVSDRRMEDEVAEQVQKAVTEALKKES